MGRCDAYNEVLRLRCDYPRDHVARHHAQVDGDMVQAWGFDYQGNPTVTITHVEYGPASAYGPRAD